MKLRYILELDLKRAIAKMGPLLQIMPKAKIKHSKRVAKELNKAKAGKIGVYAGLLHDYLERGGDLYTLSQHIDELKLPPQIIQAVHALSADEENVKTQPNQPLSHIQAVLQGIDDDGLRNIVILAKLSDRLDNLKKRGKRGKIGVKYRAKSLDLINWLSHNYTGKSKPLHIMLKAIDKLLPTVQTELT
tara:strand:- start:866 stop:1432 length:567 start_codon:yes stop_codon:yes gene_type:complete